MVDWTQFNAADWGDRVNTRAVYPAEFVAWFCPRGYLPGRVGRSICRREYVRRKPCEFPYAPWIDNATGRYVASYAILLAGTLVVGGVTGLLAAQMVKASGLTVMDRLLGTGFGLARGIIIALVLMYLLRQLAPPQNLVWLEQAQLTPYMDMLAQWVRQLFSEYYPGQSLHQGNLIGLVK